MRRMRRTEQREEAEPPPTAPVSVAANQPAVASLDAVTIELQPKQVADQFSATVQAKHIPGSQARDGACCSCGELRWQEIEEAVGKLGRGLTRRTALDQRRSRYEVADAAVTTRGSALATRRCNEPAILASAASSSMRDE